MLNHAEARNLIVTGRGDTLQDRASRAAHRTALRAQRDGVHPDVVARILVTFADALDELKAEEAAHA